MRRVMQSLPTAIAFPGIHPRTAFIVGGSVRDHLLGRPPPDTDIAVKGDPQDFARRLADRLSGRWVKIGKAELTIHRIVVGRRIFDVSALYGGAIEIDLRRRDFTVNAMAADAATGEIIDPIGGRRDLEDGVIRMVSPAVFAADPVRLIRAYRLASGLQFAIEADTRRAIAHNAEQIRRSAGERIWSELQKILTGPVSADTLAQMQEDNLLTEIFPELIPLRHCLQGGHHRWDVLTHSLQAFRHLEIMLNETDSWMPPETRSPHWTPADIPVPVLKLAILLHDVGKPKARQTDESGKVRFYGHGKKSADAAAGIAGRLRMSKRDTGYIDFVIRSHIRPLHLFTALEKGRLTGRAKTRFFRRCGRRTPDLLLHSMADILGKGSGDERNRRFVEFARQLLREYLAEFLPRSNQSPLIGGRDLITAFGLSPSPLLGQLLRKITDAQLAGEVQNRADALRLAQKLLELNRLKKKGER